MIKRTDVPRLLMEEIPLKRVKGQGSSRKNLMMLGAGGIGSNVAWLLANNPHLINRSRARIYVYDHDHVSLSNLNRSPFMMKMIGTRKVDAIAKMLTQQPVIASDGTTRRDISVYGVISQVTEQNTLSLPGIILDTRDVMERGMMVNKTWLKLSYDGGSLIAFTFRPDITVRRLFTTGRGGDAYSVIPSFYVPAAILATMAFRLMQYPSFVDFPEERAGNVNIDIDEVMESVIESWSPD